MLRTLCFIVVWLMSPVVMATTNPWLALVPELERDLPTQSPINHQVDLNERAPQIKSGSVVHALNKQNMRMPGFVVPLESDGSNITEFFLVPFFGACLHLPPPPPNQIIHVHHPKGIGQIEPWQVVWIEGDLLVKSTDIEGIASAGYAMNLTKKVELYSQ